MQIFRACGLDLSSTVILWAWLPMMELSAHIAWSGDMRVGGGFVPQFLDDRSDAHNGYYSTPPSSSCSLKAGRGTRGECLSGIDTTLQRLGRAAQGVSNFRSSTIRKLKKVYRDDVQDTH